MMTPEQIINQGTSGFYEAYMEGLERRRKLQDEERKREQALADAERQRRYYTQYAEQQHKWAQENRKETEAFTEKLHTLSRAEHLRDVADTRLYEAARLKESRENEWNQKKWNDYRQLNELGGNSVATDERQWTQADVNKAIESGAKSLAGIRAEREKAESEFQNLMVKSPSFKEMLAGLLTDSEILKAGAFTKEQQDTIKLMLGQDNPEYSFQNLVAKTDKKTKELVYERLAAIGKGLGDKNLMEAQAKYRMLTSKYDADNELYRVLMPRYAQHPSVVAKAFELSGQPAGGGGGGGGTDAEADFLKTRTGSLGHAPELFEGTTTAGGAGGGGGGGGTVRPATAVPVNEIPSGTGWSPGYSYFAPRGAAQAAATPTLYQPDISTVYSGGARANALPGFYSTEVTRPNSYSGGTANLFRAYQAAPMPQAVPVAAKPVQAMPAIPNVSSVYSGGAGLTNPGAYPLPSNQPLAVGATAIQTPGYGNYMPRPSAVTTTPVAAPALAGNAVNQYPPNIANVYSGGAGLPQPKVNWSSMDAINYARRTNMMQQAYGTGDADELQAVKNWWIQTQAMPNGMTNDQANQVAEQDAQLAAQGDIGAQNRIKNLVIQYRNLAYRQ